MAITTVEELARILRQLPLLEPAQLDQLNGPLKKQFNEPKLLARELAKRGWLTTFQVNQIFQGRAAHRRRTCICRDQWPEWSSWTRARLS